MKTAVEWLQIKMATASSEEMVENINVWFKQAKEMEKERILKAWWESPTMGKYCSAEEYYNETFKQQEQ